MSLKSKESLEWDPRELARAVSPSNTLCKSLDRPLRACGWVKPSSLALSLPWRPAVSGFLRRSRMRPALVGLACGRGWGRSPWRCGACSEGIRSTSRAQKSTESRKQILLVPTWNKCILSVLNASSTARVCLTLHNSAHLHDITENPRVFPCFPVLVIIIRTFKQMKTSKQ